MFKMRSVCSKMVKNASVKASKEKIGNPFKFQHFYKAKEALSCLLPNGAYGDRTRGLKIANLALSQLS